MKWDLLHSSRPLGHAFFLERGGTKVAVVDNSGDSPQTPDDSVFNNSWTLNKLIRRCPNPSWLLWVFLQMGHLLEEAEHPGGRPLRQWARRAHQTVIDTLHVKNLLGDMEEIIEDPWSAIDDVIGMDTEEGRALVTPVMADLLDGLDVDNLIQLLEWSIQNAR